MHVAWLEASFDVSAADAERWSDLLIDAGASSVDVADAHAGTAREVPIFAEPGWATDRAWEACRVRALFPSGARVDEAIGSVAALLGVPVPAHSTSEVPEADWVRATQSQFAAVSIDDRLWIVPSWADPPADVSKIVRLDPGLAFGTGTHATTRLCLSWLVRALKPGASVLDYGCGSGILGLAAMRLGAARASAVDIDPQAVRATTENASKNGLRVRTGTPDIIAGQRFDVVLANILAKPLVLVAPVLARHAREGGEVILSGILASQAREVASAYERWFTLAECGQEDGWIALCGARLPD